MVDRLKDKIAIITGASKGIGRACAVIFAQEGAKVMITGRDETTLQETYDMIENKDNVVQMLGDTSKSDDVKAVIDATIEKWGRIDCLIANAGVVRVGDMETFSEEDYDLLINTNLKGTWYTCKWAVPYMKEAKNGSIVIVSSVSAHIGQVSHANYASTKGGNLAFSRALAMELAPWHIRVNSISPGATDTPMLQSDVAKEARDRGTTYEEVKHEFEQQGVMGRWATPEEVAYGILWFASDEAAYITGADLLIDGGWAAR